MHAGALIDYRLRIRGVPIRWRTRIETWEPPSIDTPHRARFVDVQLRGPYRMWHHTHTFESLPASAAMPEGGTRCSDRVDYAVPGWILEPIAHRLFVKRDVERIFDYRSRRLREMFAGSAPPGA
jgi:ligand-binding SRPBCC domain-containing protein